MSDKLPTLFTPPLIGRFEVSNMYNRYKRGRTLGMVIPGKGEGRMGAMLGDYPTLVAAYFAHIPVGASAESIKAVTAAARAYIRKHKAKYPGKLEIEPMYQK